MPVKINNIEVKDGQSHDGLTRAISKVKKHRNHTNRQKHQNSQNHQKSKGQGIYKGKPLNLKKHQKQPKMSQKHQNGQNHEKHQK